jgi:hypothetical protein
MPKDGLSAAAPLNMSGVLMTNLRNKPVVVDRAKQYQEHMFVR